MATDDFFRARLDTMIDMRHSLAVLATRMPWAEIETSLAPAFAHKDRAGKANDACDLFGPTSDVVGAGVSARGRRRLPIRLMVALLYLKHAFNLSDEELVQRWSENVQWQFFSGMAYYEPRLPCDATQIGRFRRLLGEAGVEQLLKTTIEAAVSMKVIKIVSDGPDVDWLHEVQTRVSGALRGKAEQVRASVLAGARVGIALDCRPLLVVDIPPSNPASVKHEARKEAVLKVGAKFLEEFPGIVGVVWCWSRANWAITPAEILRRPLLLTMSKRRGHHAPFDPATFAV